MSLYRPHSLGILGASLLLVLAACGGAGDSGADPADTETIETTTTGPGVTFPPSDVTPLQVAFGDGLSNNDPRFAPPGVDVSQILFGLRAPDLIPSIDNPVLTPASELGEWLEPSEAVVVVSHNDDTRAYPVRVLMNHEIVNDVVGGDPVTVTYCPLCNSALSFIRVVNGEETTFGVSGMLFNSALVMYDRLTESLWLHYKGEQIVGPQVGARLEWVSTSLLSWADFLEAHPDGLVLDPPGRDNYGNNPYIGYDARGNEPFLFNGVTDPRAASMTRVVGVTIGDDAVAWSTDSLIGGEATVTYGTVGERDLVILWRSGQKSALDTRLISDGAVVGSVGVFDPVVNGQKLTFSASGGVFVDDATGSTWNILGEAIEGDLSGSQLARVPHLDTFWFAWSAYQPATTLISAAGTIPAP